MPKYASSYAADTVRVSGQISDDPAGHLRQDRYKHHFCLREIQSELVFGLTTNGKLPISQATEAVALVPHNEVS